MKLSKRIQDLVRANLTPRQWLSGLGQAQSPAQGNMQLERIRKSLAQAAAREKQLQENLALAEQAGRERDAIRLRRELAELGRSRDELQAALDLIEARVEMARQEAAHQEMTHQKQAAVAEASPSATAHDTSRPLLAELGEDADLAARKARLATPDEVPETAAAKPSQAQRK